MKKGSQWNLLSIHVYAQRAKHSHCTETTTYCGCLGKMFNYRLSYLNLKNYIKDECSYDVQKLKYISQKKFFI